MKISLITVTMGDREDGLARLNASLAAQTFRDFELIVVDQREHLEFGGSLSRARNHGIGLASGDVLAFPDDDAWYPPSTLAKVSEILSRTDVDGVSFRVTDENGICSAGGWMSAATMPLNKKNVWHAAVSCSFFIKRSAVGELRFDERLGAGSGTRFASGEDTDFVLGALCRGAKMLYDGTNTVYHSVYRGPWHLSRGWGYGCGVGAVLRKHRYSVFRLAWMVLSQGGRALQALLRFNPKKAAFHVVQATGRIFGYCVACAILTRTVAFCRICK